MKFTDKVSGKTHLICSAVLFVLIWAFWAFVHPEALSCQEESQLFVLDGEYFASHWMLGLPGLISQFLIQFYNNIYAGAAIIAAIYVLIFIVAWSEDKKHIKRDYKHYLMSLIGLLFIWMVMALTNMKLTILVMMLLGILVKKIFHRKPFIYDDGMVKPAYFLPYMLAFVLCLFTTDFTGLSEQADWNVQKYDYMARCQDWEGIMDKAKNDDTRYYVSNAYINLAYGMKGALSQRGDESGREHKSLENVFPQYDGNFLTGCALSDIYYYLGLINTSSKYAHKAIETLPHGELSARMVKRIIETDIISGNYDDARKYLAIMLKTIFYRHWAEKNLALLGDEDAINSSKFYGYARSVRIPDDNINSGQKMDEVILSLIKQNNENYLAVQYYLLIPQLEHNDKKYEMYLNYVEKKMK